MLQQMNPRLKLPTKFKPYFYGPFSQDISEALDLLENSGLIKVKAIDFGMQDSFEVRKFVYELTNPGKAAVEGVKRDYDKFVNVITL